MAARFPMAVVVVGSPLTITIEGATAVVAAEDFVGGLTTGDRVQAAFLGDRLTVIARAGGGIPSDTGWVDITFATGFESYASSSSFVCKIRKIGGIVYTRGLMKRTSGSFAAATNYATVATIPVGYRPPGFLYGAAAGDTGYNAASMVIAADGNVAIRTSATTTPPYLGFGPFSWPTS